MSETKLSETRHEKYIRGSNTAGKFHGRSFDGTRESPPSRVTWKRIRYILRAGTIVKV